MGNQAVAKGLEILTLLANSKESVTGAGIAEMTQMPNATVMSHLATLEKRGFIEIQRGGYVLTIRPALLWIRQPVSRFTPPTLKTYRTIAVMEKAIDIIEFLCARPEPASLKEIAAEIDVTTSSAAGYVESMLDTGFVSEIASAYRPGLRLSLLWARVKANLETRLNQINRDLEILTKNGGN
jgi:DNA-binding IclR family transcriptional regulator